MDIKKVGLASVLVGSLILGACGNVKEVKVGGEDAYSYGDKTVTELQVFEEMKELSGPEVVRQAIGQEILKDKYKVTDKEKKEKLKLIEAEYGSAEGLNAELKELGIDKAAFEQQLEVEISHDKALKERKNLTEEDIKKRYEEIKDVKKFIHLQTGDSKLAEKVETSMKSGKSLKEIREIIGQDGMVEEVTAANGDLEGKSAEALKLKIGEVGKYENGEVFDIYRVESEDVLKFEDIKDNIEKELIYDGLESFDDVFKYLVEKHDVKLKGKYKDLLK